MTAIFITAASASSVLSVLSVLSVVRTARDLSLNGPGARPAPPPLRPAALRPAHGGPPLLDVKRPEEVVEERRGDAVAERRVVMMVLQVILPEVADEASARRAVVRLIVEILVEEVARHEARVEVDGRLPAPRRGPR